MYGLTTVLLIASALAQPASETGQEAKAAEQIPAVVTRQTEFQLPFKVPQASAERPVPVEVRLFVSRDEGRTWQTHSRVRPDKGFCPFGTRSDGAYWFVIRTVDRRGNLWPQAAARPEMKVTVDTQPPKVDLKATWNPDGEVSATWQVDDATLVAKSPKLQFREAATDPWQTIAITPATEEQSLKQSGKATWWPKSATGQITVRFEAVDKAGNPAVAQRTIKTPASGANAELAKQNAAQPPVANNFAEPKAAANDAASQQQQANHTPSATNVVQQPVQQPVGQPAPTPPANRNAPSCQVKLTSTALQQDRMTIRWRTFGTSILRKTIHLAYSDTAEGPWLPVALNQQDDGHHVWHFNGNIPSQAFLMIEVVDRGGSTSRYVTPQPLWLRAKSADIPYTGRSPAEYRFF